MKRLKLNKRLNQISIILVVLLIMEITLLYLFHVKYIFANRSLLDNGKLKTYIY